MSQKRHLVRQSLAMLPKRDRRTYRIAVALQMSTSLLDLAGVLLFGLVGVTAVAAAQNAALPAAVQSALDLLGLQDWSLIRVATVLGIIAATLLVLKSVITLVVARWVTGFLARCSATMSARLFTEFFALPAVRVQHFGTQWVAFAVSRGVSGAVVEVLTAGMVVQVEVVLLAVLSVALLLIDPLTTVFAVAYFGAVATILTKGLAGWSQRVGKTFADSDVKSIDMVADGISTYREVTVLDRRDYFVAQFSRLRDDGSRAYADRTFLSLLPRYGMEVAMVLGAGLLIVVLISTGTPEAAAGTLALFLAAGSRVLPSLLRLNGARLQLHALVATSDFAYEIAAFIDEHRSESRSLRETEGGTDPARSSGEPSQPRESPGSDDFVPVISVRGLNVTYPDADEPALLDVSFDLPPGRHLALAGPSGAGKSTLADAILGVAVPSAGSISIGGLTPREMITKHAGAVAYVPQTVALISGSVRDNVALGLARDAVDDGAIWRALESASLAEFLRDSRDGLETVIGERGVKLSGGQRQRLGIARALYSNPRLLVLDEATSALDAETEHAVTTALASLDSSVTTVTIAHRLATIRSADLVLYMEDGRVKASGTFDEVRTMVKSFDRQAGLLGL